MKQKFSLGFLALSFLASACNDADTTKTTSDTATVVSSTDADTNKMGTNTSTINSMPVDSATSEFVAASAAGGMMEIELAKVAKDKAKSQRVKDFAAMLLSDHTAAANELKSTAAGNNIAVPASMGEEHQKHVDMMSKKSGAQFDKDYMNMMVIDHKKDIDAFKKASANLSNDAIKSYATRTLPVLQKHLDSALAITKKM